MHYKKRLIEERLRKYAESFACVLVAGARQVGKSTLLEHVFGKSHRTFVFDPVQDLHAARKDPELFLRNNPGPLILDEIQYVPELTSAIKRSVDRDRSPGRYLLTGSQQWHVMRKLADSLAGRLGTLELGGFCLSECHGLEGTPWVNRWIDHARDGADAAMAALSSGHAAGFSPAERIWRGSFPEVQTFEESVTPGWMQGYIGTYLQRDVRTLADLSDESTFVMFMALCAALTAQEVNYSQLGRDIGVAGPTARRWLGLLRSTYQWIELPAYAANVVKRISGRPKGHWADTGLACYLMRISSPQSVQGHPAYGALFESLVVGDILRQLAGRPLAPASYHYRQHSGSEVDLVLQHDGVLFPIEVKSTAVTSPADARGLGVFRGVVREPVAAALIVYSGRELLRVDAQTVAVPFDWVCD